MTNDKIQSFLLQKGKYLPKRKINFISTRLEHLEERRVPKVLSTSIKKPIVFVLLYWLLPPFFLIDRFFTGQYLSGIIKFIGLPAFAFAIVYILKQKGIHRELYFGTQLNHLILLISIGIQLLWTLVDGFTIGSRIKDHNFRKLKRVL